MCLALLEERFRHRRGLQLGHHMVEMLRQLAKLIAAERANAIIEVATADGLCPSDQGLYRPGNRPDKQQRHTDNGEDKYGNHKEDGANDPRRFLVRLPAWGE